VRFVSLDSYTPAPEWIEKAGQVLDELKAARDSTERKTIISRNDRVWAALKDHLAALSHGKCWFSEARDCFNYWHVEHFRPKNSALDLDGTEHDGYWWLAFDWRNYRLCGGVGNTAKGTHFPLRDPRARAKGPADDLRGEYPLLLDPADERDPSLLSFDFEGAAIVAPDVDDDWDRKRVEYSIGRLKLNFPALTNARKTVWQECWRHIQKYRDEVKLHQVSGGMNLYALQGARNEAAAVRKLIRSDSEFSSAARACVIASGDKQLVRLLQSM